jgi:hypothetical protein
MKAVTYAENSWLLGDEAADTLMDYAVVLARIDSADSVEVLALGPDGTEQSVSFLIGPATMMTAQSSDSSVDAPDNRDAVTLIRERIRIIESPPAPIPMTSQESITFMDELG